MSHRLHEAIRAVSKQFNRDDGVYNLHWCTRKAPTNCLPLWTCNTELRSTNWYLLARYISHSSIKRDNYAKGVTTRVPALECFTISRMYEVRSRLILHSITWEEQEDYRVARSLRWGFAIARGSLNMRINFLSNSQTHSRNLQNSIRSAQHN